MFVDFGLGLPTAGLPGQTFAGLNNIDGPGTGPDLTIFPFFTPSTTPLPSGDLSFERLHGITGGSVTFDTEADIIALQNAVLPIVKRAFAPFDIDVKLHQAKSFDDIKTQLASNNSETNGKFDAYVFVGLGSPLFCR